MANVVGVGTDLIEVDRVTRAWERFGERFLARVFTAPERAYCMARADFACALAGRFAVKEAVVKAVSPEAPSGFTFHDVAVVADGGRPRVELGGAVAAWARLRGVTEVLVSLSHERRYAVAFAVALGE